MPYDPKELAALDVSVLREITERNVSMANAPTVQEAVRRPPKVATDKAIGDLIFTSQVLIEKLNEQERVIAGLQTDRATDRRLIATLGHERLVMVASMILTIMAACAVIPFVTAWFIIDDAVSHERFVP